MSGDSGEYVFPLRSEAVSGRGSLCHSEDAL